ncbi:MAG: thermonuclease family protein [Planctomycetota bacterium]|nr:thermonuclease family protein [Planctomycetota bacterium]MDA1214924.1 thermonuclease family protein [Planctomycetota bacterium]
MIDSRRTFRLRRRLSSPGVWAALLFLIILAVRMNQEYLTVIPPQHSSPRDAARTGVPHDEESRIVVVKRVVDGDTLLLESGERVRLIGVDTPETKHPDLPVDPLGLEAAAFVQELVEGKTVELRFDRERVDSYERLLAYVYIGEQCLNEEIIRAGYSKAITRFPYRSSQKVIFIAAEHEAKNAGRKIWQPNQP